MEEAVPKWIEERARHILARNPSMPESEAWAIGTQQAHALGKTPKGYGTAEGKETAKGKYDTPKDDKKTANPGGLESSKMAALSPAMMTHLTRAGIGAGLGAAAGAAGGGPDHRLSGALKGGLVGGAVGGIGSMAASNPSVQGALAAHQSVPTPGPGFAPPPSLSKVGPISAVHSMPAPSTVHAPVSAPPVPSAPTSAVRPSATPTRQPVVSSTSAPRSSVSSPEAFAKTMASPAPAAAPAANTMASVGQQPAKLPPTVTDRASVGDKTQAHGVPPNIVAAQKEKALRVPNPGAHSNQLPQAAANPTFNQVQNNDLAYGSLSPETRQLIESSPWRQKHGIEPRAMMQMAHWTARPDEGLEGAIKRLVPGLPKVAAVLMRKQADSLPVGPISLLGSLAGQVIGSAGHEAASRKHLAKEKKEIESAQLGQLGSSAGQWLAGKATQEMGAHSTKVDAGLFNKMHGESPIPIRGTQRGRLLGQMIEMPVPAGTAYYTGPHLGSEEPPHVMLGKDSRAPSVLGHELGHHELTQSRAGRLLQNKGTLTAGVLAPAIGVASGSLSGLSDNEHVQRAGRLAPVIAAAPQVAYEGLASLKGLSNMRRSGAGIGQLARGVGTLLPAWGTYAANAGVGYYGAREAQSGVKAFRKNGREKKANFAVSQYSGDLGPAGGPPYVSGMPPFRVEPFKKPKEKTAEAMEDELMKLCGVPNSPAARLAVSRSVGAPKVTSPSGPSVADISKPTGFGMKLPGATKTAAA